MGFNISYLNDFNCKMMSNICFMKDNDCKNFFFFTFIWITNKGSVFHKAQAHDNAGNMDYSNVRYVSVSNNNNNNNPSCE